MADENVTNQAPQGGAPAPEAAPTPAPIPAPQAEPELTFDPKDIEENKVIAVLSYIFLLFLVPLLAKKESPFCQFHAKQGLVVCASWFVVAVVLALIPFIGWFLLPFVNIAFLVLCVIAAIKTFNGKAWKIPYVYDYSRKVNL